MKNDIINEKVKILISSYLNKPYENRVNTLKCLIYSLLSQTHTNFKILVHHDGPLENKNIKLEIENIDSRISFIETPERKNQWGFDVRYKLAIEEDDCKYILFTNDDNYYMPVFLEVFVAALENTDTELCYCNLIHNERNYTILDASPEIGNVDLGCFIASKSLIKKIPWQYSIKEADGIYFKKLYKNSKNPAKVTNVLFVHN